MTFCSRFWPLQCLCGVYKVSTIKKEEETYLKQVLKCLVIMKCRVLKRLLVTQTILCLKCFHCHLGLVYHSRVYLWTRSPSSTAWQANLWWWSWSGEWNTKATWCRWMATWTCRWERHRKAVLSCVLQRMFVLLSNTVFFCEDTKCICVWLN